MPINCLRTVICESLALSLSSVNRVLITFLGNLNNDWFFSGDTSVATFSVSNSISPSAVSNSILLFSFPELASVPSNAIPPIDDVALTSNIQSAVKSWPCVWYYTTNC